MIYSNFCKITCKLFHFLKFHLFRKVAHLKNLLLIVLILGILHVLFFWVFPLKQTLNALSQPLHEMCLSRESLLTSSDSQQVFGAIVCGRPLPLGSETQHTFVMLGLIHILVVSGGHYSTLQGLLKFILGSKPIIITLILFLYSAMTFFQPPGGRAFISFALDQMSKKFRLSTPNKKIEVLSGLVALCLFPEWITSLSFHLSWSLSLLLSFLPDSKFSWLKLFWIQVIAAALIGSTGSLAYLSNLVLAPFFSLFLFPLGLLILVPLSHSLGVTPLWEFVIEHSLYFLKKLEGLSQIIESPISWSHQWVACSSLILIFLVHIQTQFSKNGHEAV